MHVHTDMNIISRRYFKMVTAVMNTYLTLICVAIVLGVFISLLLALTEIGDGHSKTKKNREVNITDSRLTFEEIARGFKLPTGMVFLGPNDFLIAEKNTGKVIRIQKGDKLDKPLLTASISNQSERGLLGISLTEQGFSPRYVFLYYTEIDAKNHSKVLGNRLYRYELSENDSKLINPKLLLDLPFLPGPSHDGGVLKIGPDKKSLYLVVGNLNYVKDPKYLTQAQNVKDGPRPDGRGGILRITFDGEVVGSEGILGNYTPLSLYYAYGLRNSFGIGFDPITGNLWDTENGQSMNDEINLVKPGFNSGWSIIQGPSSKKNFNMNMLESFGGKGTYRDPEFAWADAVAPTSVLFLGSDKLGMEYENDLFVGSVHNGTIYHFDLNEDRSNLDLEGLLQDKIADTAKELESVIFAKGLGLITGLEVGPDGFLYVLSYQKSDGTIFRITPK